ncbi:hypothetical protein [Antrihabitans stalactiti]|uniref:Uncharacterized protein n=1 Tax=Antrihabitans stalactiti TaxID=2584121 RepID=A0A848KFL9_9NOCA|nr:hypothetical protein [Antrihabitans stalactiti]NMN95000.1 hypothetical protein [Antrihabitans stalactiti]
MAEDDANKKDDLLVPPDSGHERDKDLAGVVNELEERITDERRAAGAPGNADDRAKTEQVESEDQAPE